MRVAAVILAVIAMAGCVKVHADDKPKVWIAEYPGPLGSNTVVTYIEDLETGTRCYAITTYRGPGGVSCVPKQQPFNAFPVTPGELNRNWGNQPVGARP